MRLETGVKCDRCGLEEHQPEMINGYSSVVAEGNWAWYEVEGFHEANLCADCLTPDDIAAGFRRN